VTEAGAAPEDDDRAERIYSCLDPDRRAEGIAEAKQAVGRGRLVVMPTDTVYGIAADAFDPAGVRRLLRAKGRSRRVPTPVLIASADTLRALATNVSPDARELSRAFWPGGLTLICRQQPSLQWDLGDSRGTVAIRMPDQADALELLAETGPLAVSSANRHGDRPATTVDEAYDQLGDSVSVYLDAGPTPGPVPSTILDATGDTLRVVREGVISVERIREVIPAIEPDEG
jgi:tRNA threonylcarbamoyl adenosine modification protein (Sua5/YciO/YrdC/YwlC family)